MRSKNKKRKKKSAYRKGEKTAILLKRGTIGLLCFVVLSLLVLAGMFIEREFILKDIHVAGNYHLGKEDVLKMMKIDKGALLSRIDLANIEDGLTDNPWIKRVSMRKQFPDTLMVKVEEAVPTALMKIKKRLYLIDRDGEILERVKGESTHFLPVIKGIKPDNKNALSEALKMVSVMHEKKTFNDRESIVIGLETYGLTIRIDGEFIKVGYGKYADKFERWLELEPEIRRKGVPVKYVDLRFKDSVIVKPVKEKKGKSSS